MTHKCWVYGTSERYQKILEEKPLKGINVYYFLSNLLISFVILGYSYVFKSILNKNRNVIIYNLDFLYGLFFFNFSLLR